MQSINGIFAYHKQQYVGITKYDGWQRLGYKFYKSFTLSQSPDGKQQWPLLKLALLAKCRGRGVVKRWELGSGMKDMNQLRSYTSCDGQLLCIEAVRQNHVAAADDR